MLIKIIAAGMICKNPDCNYKDETFTIKDCKKWLNTPCPCCGCSLLSVEEFQAIKMLGELIPHN